MKYKHLIFCILFWSISGQSLKAQINTTPASSPCACDGAVSYTSGLSGNLFYQLTDYAGNQVVSNLNSNGFVTFTNLCPILYQLNVTGNGTSENVVFNIAVTGVNPGSAQSVTICSTNGPTPLATYIPGLLPGGVWRNPSGQLFNGTIQASTAVSGMYSYGNTIGNCTVSTGLLVTMIQNANPGLSTTYLICENYSAFEMTNVLAGNADEGGQWLTSGNLPMDGIYDPATMESALFTYMIDTVPGCGSVFSTLFILENQTPDPGISASVMVCHDAAAFNMIDELGGTPDTDGQWYNSSNAPINGIFDPTINQSGVYRYHVDGDTPCVDQDAFLTVTIVYTNPSGTDGNVAVCSADPSFNMISYLGGSPMNGGVWQNPQNQVVSGVFNPSTQPSGVYTYTYPNAGCYPSNALLTISVDQIPNAGPDQNVGLCIASGSFNLATAIAPGAETGGSWSIGGQVVSGTIPLLAPGDFTFTYTVTSPECPSDQSVLNLTVSGMPEIPADLSSVLCSTGSPFNLLDLYPGLSPLTFSDDSGNPVSSLFDPSSQAAGTYHVSHSSGNVCPAATGNILITIEDPVITDQTVQANICETDDLIDLDSYLPGISPSDGQWYNSNGTAVSSPIALNGLADAEFQFSTNAGSVCPSNTIDLLISVDAAPSAGLDTTLVFCINSPLVSLSGLLSDDAESGGTWSYNGIALVTPQFNPSTDPEGDYLYAVSANGVCPGDESVIQITLQQNIIYDAGPDMAVCAGSPPLSIGNPEQADYTYLWSPSADLSSATAAQPLLTIVNNENQPITTEYTVVVSDGVCSTQDDLSVTINPLPVISIIAEPGYCEGDIISMSANGGLTYSWEPAILFTHPTASQPGFNETSEGSYAVVATGTNEWACTSSATKEVEIYPLPQIEIESLPAEGCIPLEIQMSIGLNSQFVETIQWTLGNLEGSGNEFGGTLLESDDYTLYINAISEHGCEISLELNNILEVYPDPVADFYFTPEHPTTIDNELTISNTSTGADSYDWTIDATDLGSAAEPSLTFRTDDAGNHELCLVAVSNQGCRDTLCKNIYLINDQNHFVPNAFTPDNDGVNDVFIPIFLGYDDSDYTLMIYDRWGNQIFKTTDPAQGWSGNYQGGNYYVQEDVYVWRIEIKEKETADAEVFQGHVSVIR